MRRLHVVLGAILLAAALTSQPAFSVDSLQEAPPKDENGGPTVAHHAGGKVIGKGAAARQAPTAEVLTLDHRALEPTLGQTKDGSIFYAAADTVDNDVLRSKDGGKTWEKVSPMLGPYNRHAVSLDPYVWVDEDTGRVFTIDLTVSCSIMSYTDDQGATWTTNPLACGRPVNDHQTLFGGPPATSSPVLYDNVLYYCWNDVVSSSCGKSLNGGLTWNPTGTPAYRGVDQPQGQGEPALCGGLHGHGVVGRDGTVYLPKPHCDQPWLAISKDEGVTWETVRVSTLPVVFGPDPSVAVDDKGNIYYVWVSDDRLPYISYSKDGGKTWSKPMMVGAPGLTEIALATLDVGEPGKVAMAYYGTDDVDGPIDKREYTEKVEWNGYMTISANLFDADPIFYSGSVNDPSQPFARRACGPRRCYDGYDFIDVVVGREGTAWAAFADSDNPYKGSGKVGHLVGGPKLH